MAQFVQNNGFLPLTDSIPAHHLEMAYFMFEHGYRFNDFKIAKDLTQQVCTNLAPKLDIPTQIGTMDNQIIISFLSAEKLGSVPVSLKFHQMTGGEPQPPMLITIEVLGYCILVDRANNRGRIVNAIFSADHHRQNLRTEFPRHDRLLLGIAQAMGSDKFDDILSKQLEQCQRQIDDAQQRMVDLKEISEIVGNDFIAPIDDPRAERVNDEAVTGNQPDKPTEVFNEPVEVETKKEVDTMVRLSQPSRYDLYKDEPAGIKGEVYQIAREAYPQVKALLKDNWLFAYRNIAGHAMLSGEADDEVLDTGITPRTFPELIALDWARYLTYGDDKAKQSLEAFVADNVNSFAMVNWTSSALILPISLVLNFPKWVTRYHFGRDLLEVIAKLAIDRFGERYVNNVKTLIDAPQMFNPPSENAFEIPYSARLDATEVRRYMADQNLVMCIPTGLTVGDCRDQNSEEAGYAILRESVNNGDKDIIVYFITAETFIRIIPMTVVNNAVDSIMVHTYNREQQIPQILNYVKDVLTKK